MSVSELWVYGLTQCDTCRKTLAALRAADRPHTFVDLRKHPVDEATLRRWSQQLGGWERMINRSGTTWRGLPEARKQPVSEADWLSLLRDHPALIRRPLVVEDGVAQIRRFPAASA